MQFNQQNIRPGMTVMCGDFSHMMKARRVEKIDEEGVYVVCPCEVGMHVHEHYGLALFLWDEITAIVSDPDNGWHKMNKENVELYLKVGDEIEIEALNGAKEKGLIINIVGNTILLHTGSVLGLSTNKFRLIKKAEPVEEKPKTAVDLLKFCTSSENAPPLTMETLDKAFKLLSEESFEPITKPKSLIEKTMDSLKDISNKAKLLAIGITNPDEKLAIENGIKHLDGSYTPTFLSFVGEKEMEKKRKADEEARKAKEAADKAMFAAYEAEMLAEIKAVKANEEKK